MLINLRNALTSGRRPPYDAEVEYLQSTGTQYINTGIKPSPNTRVEIVFAMTTFTANCGLFGARGSAAANNASYNLFIISNSGARVRWDWSGSGQYQTSEADTSTDATYVLGAAGGNITRNGSTVMSVSASKAAINYPLYVFNFNNVGTPYSTGANARFWSVKIYDGQTLVFDAIPVRKGTVGYLYDRVSGKLFGNAGTGDFVLGPDVVPVEYLQANNTSYTVGSTIGGVIDTGIVANLGTDVWVCDAQFVSFGDTAGCWGRTGDRFAFGRGSKSWYDWYYGFGNTNNRTNKAYDNNRHLFVLDGPNRRLTIDGVSYSGSGAAVAGSFTLAIFNRTGVNGISYCQDNSESRCYSAKLYRSDVLLQDLIPVRVGTDATSWEGAMMDVLTRRVYRNAGTGAFTYGNDLKYPIPAS